MEFLIWLVYPFPSWALVSLPLQFPRTLLTPTKKSKGENFDEEDPIPEQVKSGKKGKQKQEKVVESPPEEVKKKGKQKKDETPADTPKGKGRGRPGVSTTDSSVVLARFLDGVPGTDSSTSFPSVDLFKLVMSLGDSTDFEGRPRFSPPEEVKKKGKQKKDETPADTPKGKGRGRPRKEKEVADENVEMDEEEEQDEMETDDQQEPEPKKKRGRPSKSVESPKDMTNLNKSTEGNEVEESVIINITICIFMYNQRV
jgi:hypothetical protein